MVELLVRLGKLSIGFLCIVGPIALLLAFLQLRNQRESVLFATVIRELNLPDLRGLFTVKVQSRLIGADTVEIDLWHCSREQVWSVIEKISTQLPEHVRFQVNGITDCRVRSTWNLTVMRSQPSVSYCP